MKLTTKYGWLLSLIFSLYIVVAFAGQAHANKYMSLEEAIKYYLPQGSKVFKVAKTIPSDQLEATKKRFRLQSNIDFKEVLSPGPYTFYVGRDANGAATAYILILEQYWRTCYHKYAIGIEPDGKIKDIVVVELNCRFAYPINRKSFLKQFKDKKVERGQKVPVEVGDDIDAVSGATVSSATTAMVTRRALALYELFFATKK
jgi:hypothetical protein